MGEAIIEFSVDVSCLKRLAVAAPQLEPLLADEAKSAMLESGMVLDTMVAARTPVNYGLLRSSIQWPRGFELEDATLDHLRGIVGAADFSMAFGGGASTMVYVDWVEDGTRAHWAPIAPLLLWATRKFGQNARGIAYAVRYKIAQYGTKAYHMFRNAWYEGGRAKVERIWSQVPAKALKRWRVKL